MDLFLGFTPKGLIPMEIFVHPYIPMILPTSSQCGTLVVYPTILPSNKGPSSLPSNDYPSVHSLPTRILRSNALEAHTLHATPPVSRACSNWAYPRIPLWYYYGSPPSFSIPRIHLLEIILRGGVNQCYHINNHFSKLNDIRYFN